MVEEMELTKDLEATISFHQSKLQLKEDQLAEREKNEHILKEENQQMALEMEEKNQEILKLQQDLVFHQQAIAKEQMAQREMSNLLLRLQDVAGINQQLEAELELNGKKLHNLELEK